MLEQISKILSGIGYAGGIIGVLAALITAVSKLQPLTLLTATLPEQVFLSKEKRATKKIIDFVLETLGLSLFFSAILFYSYLMHFKYYIWVSLVMLIFTLAGLILALSTAFSKKMREFIRKKIFEASGLYKFLYYVIYFLIFFSYISLVPYIWGSYSATINNMVPENQDLWVMSATIYIYIFILSSFLVAGLKYLIKIMESKKYDLSGKALYFLEKGTLKQWFIYHPTDKFNFLVGDSPDPYISTKYKFVGKSILITETIYLYKKDEDTSVI